MPPLTPTDKQLENLLVDAFLVQPYIARFMVRCDQFRASLLDLHRDVQAAIHGDQEAQARVNELRAALLQRS